MDTVTEFGHFYHVDFNFTWQSTVPFGFRIDNPNFLLSIASLHVDFIVMYSRKRPRRVYNKQSYNKKNDDYVMDLV